jgi:hypothetical protein
MKRIIIFMTIIASISGCTQYDVTELLLSRNDVSLTCRGVEEFVYVPESCQMGYNDKSNTFYVYEDRLSDWFSVVCDADPSAEGQELKADVSWTTKTSTRSFKELSFKVEKIDADGHIWLWNSTNVIGIVIKKL